MRRTIAICMLGLGLIPTRAAAQTATERAQILRDFQVSVVEYAGQDRCLAVFPEANTAATAVPRVFTLPVAMVFRQMIARTLAVTDGPVMSGVGATHRAAVMQPFPTGELTDFPKVLTDALPVLPPSLEYRLVGNDLVIRDAGADVVIAVLRDALSAATTR
ncbi:MAG TPA: hypothetical protein VF491_08725 [Vicinamibacterales bacterium]